MIGHLSLFGGGWGVGLEGMGRGYSVRVSIGVYKRMGVCVYASQWGLPPANFKGS